MSQTFAIHAETPQGRLISQVVDIINKSGVIIYPTDATYALGCRLRDKQALGRIRQIRQFSDKHPLTLMCRDLSHIAQYARLSKHQYRILKAYTPGPYTFILPASREVPKRLLQKRSAIGIRVADNPISQAILQALDEPLISSTLTLPHEELVYWDPEDIKSRFSGMVDAIIDGGVGHRELTSIIDLTGDAVEVIREGLGPVDLG